MTGKNKHKTGCIQIYTGNGKGKTTAALGLAVRAAGHGMKTCIIQFMKGKNNKYGEHQSLSKLDEIDFFLIGTNDCIRKEDVGQKHIKAANKGLKLTRYVMKNKKYDVLILDEIIVAVWFGIVDKNAVLDIINSKPDAMELVLTGRYAAAELLNKADLVTEMNIIKHPYEHGLKARIGIEY
ncbi:MAG: cob(I)yrinic acid a,c-diamide adenosyltransferase [Candidatus Delongbacteria bacterium]|jgi:cob(I)alamin adenosyltransferase|nr:cob(I)yrinic acid a,c-diamide adenosyltransferase [Candidatus Delongbacteria bacterium]